MAINVTDPRSNASDQIVHAARVLNRSKQRKKVFLAIYSGKRKKTITELMKLTDMSRVRVLQETRKLADNYIIKKVEKMKETTYTRYPFYMQHKNQILRIAGNEQAINKVATKTNPRIRGIALNVVVPKKSVNIRQIAIDEIDSFQRVREIPRNQNCTPVLEKNVKKGIQKILGEPGDFQDWGGETDDLFSTGLIFGKERKAVAFALKGRATTGKLTPKKMGKNGDQIQRLFRAPAEIFIMQYWSDIDESVIEQMKICAIGKSFSEGRKIYYCVIDGRDTARLFLAYPEFFSNV